MSKKTILINDVNSWQKNRPIEWVLDKSAEFEARNALTIESLQAPSFQDTFGIMVEIEGMSEEEVKQELAHAENVWNALVKLNKTYDVDLEKPNLITHRSGKLDDIWMDAYSINSILKGLTVLRKVAVNYSCLWIIIRQFKIQQYKAMYLNEKMPQELKDYYEKLVDEKINEAKAENKEEDEFNKILKELEGNQ